jgi:hypothetical protein
MKTVRWLGGLGLALLVAVPASAWARGLSVELWTDKGMDAVYEPGDRIDIKARASDDAYLLVYEIDAEGAVHVLYPMVGQSGQVEGHRTYRLPADDRGELVVDSETGEGYIVAVASREPFGKLPWYLRPYDMQAEGIGYTSEGREEEGVTSEGQIVGDPFVAMERIRRRVLHDPKVEDDFGTAYVDYYVHERVRYPRYLCNDCHRPGLYTWWDGFDPYYTTCTVFDFRVNWSWGWGPRYWFGSVPYYAFIYRDDCPPYYRRHHDGWYSSWDGWHRWCGLWGAGGLRRLKSPPPPGYTPPERYRQAVREGRPIRQLPPGFIAANYEKRGVRMTPPVGRGHESVGGDDRRIRGDAGPGGPRVSRDPGVYDRRERNPVSGGGRVGDVRRARGGEGGAPGQPREERIWRPSSNPAPREFSRETPRDQRGSGGYDRPRQESPRFERSRDSRPAPAPRQERHSDSRGSGAQQRSRDGGGGGGRHQR